MAGTLLGGEIHIPDEQLALDVQHGKQAALAQLVERHHNPLMGYLFRMTSGDRQLAEDLVQETFLRMVRGINRYAYPRPFKPWLYAIATNLGRDHYKAADFRLTADLHENVWHETSPEENALILDEVQSVIRALAAIPDFQREVIVLRFYQALSLAEIADALDIPLGTVKSRLSLGIKRLRDMLHTSDIGDMERDKTEQAEKKEELP